MTSNSSASRTALVVVIALIIGIAIWAFWPQLTAITSSMLPGSDTKLSKTDAYEGDNMAENAKAEVPSPSAEAEGHPLPESNSAENDKNLTRTTKTETPDFRLKADDKFASVPSGQFFTTSGVSDLTPDKKLNMFRVGQRVYAYAAIHAPRKETVRITWFDSANKEIPPSAYLDVLVNTGPVGYRVFTYRTFRKSGVYRVRLFNSVGNVIGGSEFRVK